MKEYKQFASTTSHVFYAYLVEKEGLLLELFCHLSRVVAKFVCTCGSHVTSKLSVGCTGFACIQVSMLMSSVFTHVTLAPTNMEVLCSVNFKLPWKHACILTYYYTYIYIYICIYIYNIYVHVKGTSSQGPRYSSMGLYSQIDC